MEMENYLLQRARLILIELGNEHERIWLVDKTNSSPEKELALLTIKSMMIDVEEGIKMLENIPKITL